MAQRNVRGIDGGVNAAEAAGGDDKMSPARQQVVWVRSSSGTGLGAGGGGGVRMLGVSLTTAA